MFSFDPPVHPPAWTLAPDVRARLAAATTQPWAAADAVDLGIGQPDPTLLPVDLFERAFAVNPLDTTAPLQYGHPNGDGFLRGELARFLTGAYGTSVDPEAMLITNGNSHGIDLACTVLASPGDLVVVEEPTYFLALDIFREHGLRVVGVPVDADGMDVDALAAILATDRPAFVYTIPTFHNPTGATMSADRRRRLVELAIEYGTVVVADEVYHLLSFDGAAPPPLPLAAAVESGAVVSLGTFSKLLAPGLRLGWLQAAPALVERFAASAVVTSGGGFAPFTGAVVRRIVERGWLADHVTAVRRVLGARAAVLHDAVSEHLPEAGLHRANGGYFVWLRLPGEVDTARWAAEAARRGVGYRPGSLFSTVAGGQADRLRLSWAFYPADRLGPAVEALAAIIRGTPGNQE